MKVTFYCDNGANIHSTRKETFDISKHLLISDEEWLALTEEEKFKVVEEWAMERLNIWFEEME